MQIWEINYILRLIKGREKWLIRSNSNPISDANTHFLRRLEHSFLWQLYAENWINRSVLIQTTLEIRYWSDKVNNRYNCVHSCFQLTTKSNTQHTQVNKTVEWFSVSENSWHRNAKSVWPLTSMFTCSKLRRNTSSFVNLLEHLPFIHSCLIWGSTLCLTSPGPSIDCYCFLNSG